jgi:hypothetical protein
LVYYRNFDYCFYNLPLVENVFNVYDYFRNFF